MDSNLPTVTPRRRWFSTAILYQTSAGNQHPAYVVQIVDESYKEIYKETLTVVEYAMFEQLIKDNKYALLYKNHPKLSKAAFAKIDWVGDFEYSQ